MCDTEEEEEAAAEEEAEEEEIPIVPTVSDIKHLEKVKADLKQHLSDRI